MRHLARSLIAVLSLAAALGWFGGAIHWDREPPYVLVASWGERGGGPGQFDEPSGIAVSSNQVFVADAHNRRIQVFDRQGRFQRTFGQEVLQRPMNLSWRRGRLYVADFFADAIFVFDAHGRLQTRISAADGLHNPGGVDAFPDGTLLVADTYHHRVIQLSEAGRVLQSWGRQGQNGSRAGQFSYPTDVAIRPDGGFYVADGYNDRIQQFAPDGSFLRKWGGPFGANLFGPFKGWFATVTSVALGPDGRVVAADFYNDRVQHFTAEGRYLTIAAAPAAALPRHSAIAVTVDDASDVWVANYALDRVEQWRAVAPAQ